MDALADSRRVPSSLGFWDDSGNVADFEDVFKALAPGSRCFHKFPAGFNTRELLRVRVGEAVGGHWDEGGITWVDT